MQDRTSEIRKEAALVPTVIFALTGPRIGTHGQSKVVVIHSSGLARQHMALPNDIGPTVQDAQRRALGQRNGERRVTKQGLLQVVVCSGQRIGTPTQASVMFDLVFGLGL